MTNSKKNYNSCLTTSLSKPLTILGFHLSRSSKEAIKFFLFKKKIKTVKNMFRHTVGYLRSQLWPHLTTYDHKWPHLTILFYFFFLIFNFFLHNFYFFQTNMTCKAKNRFTMSFITNKSYFLFNKKL